MGETSWRRAACTTQSASGTMFAASSALFTLKSASSGVLFSWLMWHSENFFHKAHQRGRALVVAQMSALRGNARFKIIRVRPRHQHVVVIICFQRHHICEVQVCQHLVAYNAKVGGDAGHFPFRRGDAVAAAGHRVVACLIVLHAKAAYILAAPVYLNKLRVFGHKAAL